MDPEIPKTLMDAMSTNPAWLRAWVNVLVATNLAAVLFVVGKVEGRWRIRPEPVAILVGFIGAAVFMESLYQSFGYVRLLGLAHIVVWGPVWGWLLMRRQRYAPRSLFGGYIHIYLVIAGISLVVDVIDVIRFVLGDGAL